MRRSRDQYLAPAIWQKIFEGKSVPQPSQHSEFLEILITGLRMQFDITQGDCGGAARHFLERYADLDAPFDDVSPFRAAAAYMLWPYYATRYYGLHDCPARAGGRLLARRRLCRIQALIYNNVRTTLDVLRRWFGVSSDAELGDWISDPATRMAWRDPRLLPPVNVPDLCAIDMLAKHLLELVAARPLVRKAVESIQSLSMVSPDQYLKKHDKYRNEVCGAVREAFHKLHVAQMTVFYHPNPGRPSSDLPLQELVHAAGDMDPIPNELIPFFEEYHSAEEAKSFRQLATKIYSALPDKPKFFAHRQKTIDRIAGFDDEDEKVTLFISDGETTNFFLTTEPPIDKDMWPLWYKMTLRDLADKDDPPDWSGEEWWDPVDEATLVRNLFPSGGGDDNGKLHANHHMSAYWDIIAHEQHRFLDHVEIPKQRPTSATARFGYLMELLLRRQEPETRTSFFFALAQTYEQSSQLCHFVGGTFRGLEMPGVPFCEERFTAIAARMRALVMAVAHYTTTHAIKADLWLRQQRRMSFENRIEQIVRLLQGESAQGQSFDRGGYLLFSTPVPNKGEIDHDYWGRTQDQLHTVFDNATHLAKPKNLERGLNNACATTWKALFYLGGDTERTMSTFGGFREWEPQVPGDLYDRSDRSIDCTTCFCDVFDHLLGDVGRTLSGKDESGERKVKVNGLFYLPSRPGVRFLITLCRFIVNVQGRSSEGTSITRVTFDNGQVTLSLDNPVLIQRLSEKGCFREDGSAPPQSVVQTAGILELVKNNRVFADDERKSPWHEFLCDSKYGRRVEVVPDEENLELRFRWAI
jgi:hypothetical protein